MRTRTRDQAHAHRTGITSCLMHTQTRGQPRFPQAQKPQSHACRNTPATTLKARKCAEQPSITLIAWEKACHAHLCDHLKLHTFAVNPHPTPLLSYIKSGFKIFSSQCAVSFCMQHDIYHMGIYHLCAAHTIWFSLQFWVYECGLRFTVQIRSSRIHSTVYKLHSFDDFRSTMTIIYTGFSHAQFNPSLHSPFYTQQQK